MFVPFATHDVVVAAHCRDLQPLILPADLTASVAFGAIRRPLLPQQLKGLSMKLFAGLLALSVSLFPNVIAPHAAIAQSPAIAGTWQGFATRGTAQIPIVIRISGSGSSLKAAFLNGPADHPDEAPASAVSFDGSHLVASFDYYARKPQD